MGTRHHPIAHIKPLENGGFGRPHDLKEHLLATARGASQFAESFNASSWAYIAGLWHDLGKYSDEFQQYIRLASGYSEDPSEAHIENGKTGRVDHSTAGAQWAIEQLTRHFSTHQGLEVAGPLFGKLIAYIIAGHHAGLPDWSVDDGGQSSLVYRLQKKLHTQNLPFVEIPKEVKEGINPIIPAPFEKGLDLSLWIRMLFSSLVDADFLDTERYMDEGRTGHRGSSASIGDLKVVFDKYMGALVEKVPNTKVNELRSKVLEDCRKKAGEKQGIFLLTVPTGGGKTLSSMAFALSHAAKHNLSRVIYVIPYTSILEQTTEIFRSIFGDDMVIEHHSNLDPDKETTRTRLATENWDAPIIVTTSVQFFESLFAAKTSRCRKLHNIVASVVILDEVQLLPINFMMPILETVELLHQKYRVTFALSTATQPALLKRDGFAGLASVSEIVSEPEVLERELRRVSIQLPRDLSRPVTWESVASELLEHKVVLCIVSDRKSCRTLHRLLPKGTLHLSALMCGQHRSEIVAEIKQRLTSIKQSRSDEPLRVVSTQLVEAGVDIDFPVVYRAMAGLDSIAQAAGRCNREGLSSMGMMKVFIPPIPSPPGILRKSEDVARSLLLNSTGEPVSKHNFQIFFENLYARANNLDQEGILDLLSKNYREGEISFRTAAEKFRLIDDHDSRSVIVPYGNSEFLLSCLVSSGPERWLMRKLQRYTVNIYMRDFDRLLKKEAIQEVWSGIFALKVPPLYSKEIGFIVDDEITDQSCFII